jgi:hypothetical protein
MRPKPLMPTFTAAMIFGCSCQIAALFTHFTIVERSKEACTLSDRILPS